MKTAFPTSASALLYDDARPVQNLTIVTVKPHASSVERVNAEQRRDDERRADLHGLEQEIRATRLFLEISQGAHGEPCPNAIRKLAELESSYGALSQYFRIAPSTHLEANSIPQTKLKLGRFSNDDT